MNKDEEEFKEKSDDPDKDEKNEIYSKEEEEKIRKRLRRLGYI